MKKLIALLSGCMLSGLAYSAPPPAYCQYGKVTSGFPEPAECHSPNQIIRNQFINAGLCKASGGVSNASMDGFLKIEVDKYLLIGGDHRIKGDGDWLGNGNGAAERIAFFDSITGDLGTRNTNSEGNAYLNYDLHSGYVGGGQVWVINREYYNVCSKKDVFYQNKPHISPNGFSIPFNISASHLGINFPSGLNFYYEVDWNSKTMVESIPAKITVYQYRQGSNKQVVGSAQVSNKSGTVAINPNGYSISQPSTFTVEINDGTFSSGELFLGNFNYVPSIPTACLAACPASMQTHHRHQCQASSHACNYRTWP